MKRTASNLPGLVEAVVSHEMKDSASSVGTLHKHECTCAQMILAGPVKVATYREISLLTPTIPTRCCIVALINDA